MKVRKGKKPYDKPRLVHRDKVDTLSAVCDSAWTGKRPCRLVSQPGCIKTRT